jgi:nucleotide-binding universal stress UspA family protein
MKTDWRYEMLESPPELDLEQSDARERMREIVREFSKGRQLTTMLMKHVSVPQAVASAADQLNVDLLVIGTRGRGGLRKLALGSVAEELLRSAQCPVMTVGPNSKIDAADTSWGIKSILFATDFGKGSTKALPLVLSLAARYQSKLILMHMTPPMPATSASLSAYSPGIAAADELQDWERSARQRSLRRLREWLPADTGLKQEPEYIVGTDFLPEGILIAAQKFDVDLIVMGANHALSAKIAAHTPWTTVHEVVRNAPCAVLTVAG